MIESSRRKWLPVAARVAVLALGLAAAASQVARAQMKTLVPPVVPGARPVIVQHIKIHSPAIVGNLEGEPADRDVISTCPTRMACCSLT